MIDQSHQVPSRFDEIVRMLRGEEWFDWLRDRAQETVQDRADPSHDIGHALVVLATAVRLGIYMEEKEGATVDHRVLAASALCHDLVVRRKDDRDSTNDTDESAHVANALLVQAVSYGFPRDCIVKVCHIVRECSYSRGVQPNTLEEKLVRDADLLECTGARGVARFFISSGIMNRAIVDLKDPRARMRERAIWKNALDTMRERGIEASRAQLYTPAAKSVMLGRLKFMECFISEVIAESSGAERFIDSTER